jgi:hypothetical protein
LELKQPLEIMSSDERSVTMEPKAALSEHIEQDVTKVVHADGTVDYIDSHAVGGDVDDMPKGYFYSAPFIGTVLVSTPQPPSRDDS